MEKVGVMGTRYMVRKQREGATSGHKRVLVLSDSLILNSSLHLHLFLYFLKFNVFGVRALMEDAAVSIPQKVRLVIIVFKESFTLFCFHLNFHALSCFRSFLFQHFRTIEHT